MVFSFNYCVFVRLSVTNHGFVHWLNTHCMPFLTCWRSAIMLFWGFLQNLQKAPGTTNQSVSDVTSKVFATKHWTIDLHQSWNPITLKKRCPARFSTMHSHGSVRYWKTQSDCDSLLSIYPVVSECGNQHKTTTSRGFQGGLKTLLTQTKLLATFCVLKSIHTVHRFHRFLCVIQNFFLRWIFISISIVDF